jgi:hypothetical protein
MNGNERPPEREPEPEPVVDEEESTPRPELAKATGGAIDVDAAHDRSS